MLFMRSHVCAFGILALMPAISVAQQASHARTVGAETEFHRGYFLEHEQGDLEAALQAYENALRDNSALPEVRHKIEERLKRIRQDLASSDLARLMPADSLAYIETDHPAENLQSLIRMLGLDSREQLVSESAPAPDQLAAKSGLPQDFRISPALVREVRKLHGAAAAITGLDQRGEPIGLAILNTGQSDLLQGMLETGIQFAPGAEPTDGHPTYQLDRDAWVVRVGRLYFVSNRRELIRGADLQDFLQR